MTLRPGRLVIVSPHLDDAVLSAFALLTAAREATVITVFAGIPDVTAAPADWDRVTRSGAPAERVVARRLEDRRVLGSLGVRAVHLDFPDQPYRSHDPRPSEVAAAIAAVLPEHDTLVVAAAIGGHGDHDLARDGGLQIRTAGVRFAMADLPYAAALGWPSFVTGRPDPAYLDPAAAWQSALDRLALAAGRRPDLVVQRLTPALGRAKVAAIRGYATQFGVLEAGPSRALTHPQRLGFEVAWGL